MKAMILVMALAMPAALLAGCGSSNDPGATQQAVGNAMLDRNDVIVKDLAAKKVVLADPTKSAEAKAQADASLQTIVNLNDKTQLTALAKLLNEFVANGKQILDITKKDQVQFTGDRAAYGNQIKLAQFYAGKVAEKLTAITAAEKAVQTPVATPSPAQTPAPRPTPVVKSAPKKAPAKATKRTPVKKAPVKKTRTPRHA